MSWAQWATALHWLTSVVRRSSPLVSLPPATISLCDKISCSLFLSQGSTRISYTVWFSAHWPEQNHSKISFQELLPTCLLFIIPSNCVPGHPQACRCRKRDCLGQWWDLAASLSSPRLPKFVFDLIVQKRERLKHLLQIPIKAGKLQNHCLRLPTARQQDCRAAHL